jgi:hypothetical protein
MVACTKYSDSVVLLTEGVLCWRRGKVQKETADIPVTEEPRCAVRKESEAAVQRPQLSPSASSLHRKSTAQALQCRASVVVFVVRHGRTKKTNNEGLKKKPL